MCVLSIPSYLADVSLINRAVLAVHNIEGFFSQNNGMYYSYSYSYYCYYWIGITVVIPMGNITFSAVTSDTHISLAV
jgi:hypothetical protein